jgi:hypothetical protein
VSATLAGEPATVDDAEWTATVEDACDRIGDQHAELAAAVPEDADGARRHAAAVAAFTADYAAVFGSVDDPSGDPAAGRTVRQLATRLADAGRQLDDAAQAGDVEGARRAVARIDRLGAALDAALEPWELEACRGFGDLGVTTP